MLLQQGISAASLKAIGLDFNVPAFLENLGTVNLIGESQAGAARGIRDVILITLGTGGGGMIMVNGKVLGGEIGHVYIDEGKAFQQYCSATSVVLSACSRLDQSPNSLPWFSSEAECPRPEIFFLAPAMNAP